MENDICVSIREHRILRFQYAGGLRIVEPYCQGISTAGNEVLRAYQIGGFSRSEDAVGWRLFDLAKMDEVELTGEIFEPDRPAAGSSDRNIEQVNCCV